ISRSPAITSLLNGHAAKTGFGSTRVTSSRGSTRFKKRAAVAPANPPPMTTIRGCRPWASSGRGSTHAQAPAAEALTKRPRVGRSRVTAASPLHHEPGGNRLDLVIGKALGDTVHDGRGPLPAPIGLHGRHHGVRILSGQPRHWRVDVRLFRMASGTRRRAGRDLA